MATLLYKQVYSIEGTDQCLIGTSEIPVAGIHMDSILPESQLPLKYVAYSHCFRTEAGAAGTATRQVVAWSFALIYSYFLLLSLYDIDFTIEDFLPSLCLCSQTVWMFQCTTLLLI